MSTYGIANNAGRIIATDSEGHASGTMPVAITLANMPRLIAKTRAALADHTLPADLTLPKMTPNGDLSPDANGDVGSQVRQRRWALAYMMTCNLMGVDAGRAYALPCYLCGVLYDAWTLDAEHIVSERNGGESTPENMLLACSHCNTIKGDFAEVAEPVRDRIAALAYGHLYPRGAASLKPLWNARPRRKTRGQKGRGIQHSRAI